VRPNGTPRWDTYRAGGHRQKFVSFFPKQLDTSTPARRMVFHGPGAPWLSWERWACSSEERRPAWAIQGQGASASGAPKEIWTRRKRIATFPSKSVRAGGGSAADIWRWASDNARSVLYMVQQPGKKVVEPEVWAEGSRLSSCPGCLGQVRAAFENASADAARQILHCHDRRKLIKQH